MIELCSSIWCLCKYRCGYVIQIFYLIIILTKEYTICNDLKNSKKHTHTLTNLYIYVSVADHTATAASVIIIMI